VNQTATQSVKTFPTCHENINAFWPATRKDIALLGKSGSIKDKLDNNNFNF